MLSVLRAGRWSDMKQLFSHQHWLITCSWIKQKTLSGDSMFQIHGKTMWTLLIIQESKIGFWCKYFVIQDKTRLRRKSISDMKCRVMYVHEGSYITHIHSCFLHLVIYGLGEKIHTEIFWYLGKRAQPCSCWEFDEKCHMTQHETTICCFYNLLFERTKHSVSVSK